MIIIITKHTPECTKLHYIIYKISKEHAAVGPYTPIDIPQRDAFRHLKFSKIIPPCLNMDLGL